jgi:hypothetical protein
MRRIARFLRLSFSDQLLLIRAVLLLLMARISLRLFTLRTTRRLFSSPVRNAAKLTVSQIVWSVNSASRLLPFISCMPQAIVAQRLLASHGYSAAMRVGVAPPGNSELQAHAWLEYQGAAVLGASQLDRYTILLTLEPEQKTHV